MFCSPLMKVKQMLSSLRDNSASANMVREGGKVVVLKMHVGRERAGEEREREVERARERLREKERERCTV